MLQFAPKGSDILRDRGYFQAKNANSFNFVQVFEGGKNELGKANFLGRKFKGKWMNQLRLRQINFLGRFCAEQEGKRKVNWVSQDNN